MTWFPIFTTLWYVLSKTSVSHFLNTRSKVAKKIISEFVKDSKAFSIVNDAIILLKDVFAFSPGLSSLYEMDKYEKLLDHCKQELVGSS